MPGLPFAGTGALGANLPKDQRPLGRGVPVVAVSLRSKFAHRMPRRPVVGVFDVIAYQGWSHCMLRHEEGVQNSGTGARPADRK